MSDVAKPNEGDSQSAGGAVGGESQSAGWLTGIKSELRGDPRLKEFQNPTDLAAAYFKTHDRVSELEKRPTVPGKDSKPEEWDAFYRQMGRPDKPEDYPLERLKHKDTEIADPEQEANFKAWAHKHGLSKDAVAEINRLNIESAKKVIERLDLQGAQYAAASKASLEKEWGGDFQKNLDLADRAMLHLGGEDVKKAFEQTGLNNHPTVVKFFKSLGEKITEDSTLIGRGAAPKAQPEVFTHPTTKALLARAKQNG